MRCCPWMIGAVAAAFGAGILIGGLLPSWLVVWLLGVMLIFAGIILLQK